MSDFFLPVSLHPCYVPADKGMAENVDFLKQVELKEYSAPALDDFLKQMEFKEYSAPALDVTCVQKCLFKSSRTAAAVEFSCWWASSLNRPSSETRKTWTQPVLISEWLAAHVIPFTRRCFYPFVYSRFCEQVKSCFAQYCSIGAATHFVFVTRVLTSWTFHGKQNMCTFICFPLSNYYRTVLLGGCGMSVTCAFLLLVRLFVMPLYPHSQGRG